MHFGEMLRQARQDAGRTMGELARHLGVRVPYLSDVERCKRPPLSEERILSACELLGIDPDELLGAASRQRGAFELDAEQVSDAHREVGAALARGWAGLEKQELEQINRILVRKRERRND